MELPRHILDRVERVYAYHRASRLYYTGHPLRGDGPQPSSHRHFHDHPKVSLPTTLLDAPLDTLAVLESALAALPDSFISPPQTLKTLASWLFMADGIIGQDETGEFTHDLRTCPSAGDLFPFEIYVASFALQDLEPGLYHYSPREFALRRLRDGPETLAQIKRGRPDLEFIKRAPAALLISTIYCRSSWRFAERGYRSALLDAGQLVQNLVTTAGGLGIQTITRLRMTDSTMRELIGLTRESGYGDEESVQAMVVWADRTQREAILSHAPPSSARDSALAAVRAAAPPDPSGDSDPGGEGGGAAVARAPAVRINAGAVSVASFDVPDLLLPGLGRKSMPAIARASLAARIEPCRMIPDVHEDCVAPGVAIREIRPPLTELSPLPDNFLAARLAAVAGRDHGLPLRTALLKTRPALDFPRDPIPRDAFRTISRFAFAGGSYFPLFPSGVHAALVRPFWVVHNVSGMDPGIWFYRSDYDEWCLLRADAFRLETQYLTCEDDAFGNAAAVCFMVANMHALMMNGGPDTYRLAHLEAGTIAQRLLLAARGFHLAAKPTAAFYDEELKKFLGLEQTGWEPLHAVAIGAVH
jgi:SagB-type dehydrogenase family enzyme